MTTVSIFREQTTPYSIYRAVSKGRSASGASPGQALDAIEQLLSQSNESDGTIVILQRFKADEFFTAAQKARLEELMDAFHEAHDANKEMPRDKKAELEALVEAELRATILRSEAILTQTGAS